MAKLLPMISSILRVPPKRTPNDWARERRVLPPGSAEPGPFRPERTPYFEALSDVVASGKYERLVIVCATQMAKTDFCLNVVGQRMDDDPTPAMFVAPTKKLVESISRDRFMKMARGAKTLWRKMAKGKMNLLTEKYISGVAVRFLWASSPTELASNPGALIIVDERDRMSDNVGGEGDPVVLVWARASTYPDPFMIICSTPTIIGDSPILKHYNEGTCCKFAWPCPHCHEYFVPCLKQHKWPENVDKDTVFGQSYLECPHCQGKVTEDDKEWCNIRGTYLGPNQTAKLVDDKPEVEGELAENMYFSAWISGLCSPWRTMDKVASHYIAAVADGHPEEIQAVVNTDYGEGFAVEGEAIEIDELRQCELQYQAKTLPESVRLLTAGVDVQRDCLYFSIRGWGEEETSYLIWADRLWGDTAKQDVWDQLSGLLNNTWQGQDGRYYPIKLMVIDGGYRPEMVYLFCKKHPMRAIPSRGAPGDSGVPVRASQIEVSIRGRKIKGGIRLWHHDKWYFRSWLFSKVRREAGTPGSWNLPAFWPEGEEGIQKEYYRQVTAEHLVEKPSGQKVWAKRRRHNHWLDAEVLNAAASFILRVGLLIKARRTGD